MTFRLTKRPKQSVLQQYSIIRDEVRKSLEPVADQHVSQRNAVVGGWRHRPQFRGVVAVGPKQISLRVVLQNAGETINRYGTTIRQLWTFHNDGTRAHDIRPRFARVLRFVVGAVVVFTRLVKHPGTRGQKTNDKINRRLRRFEQSQIRRGFANGWKRLRRELR